MIITYSVDFVGGKERPRFTKRGRTFTPRKTQDNERRILDAYKGACVRRYGRVVAAPPHVPVTVAVSCKVAAPQRRPDWCPKALWDALQGVPFVCKPDIDNVLKLHLDALNGHAWHDDSQVTQTHAFKLPRKVGGNSATYVLVTWEGEEDGE